jgi:hypothetical protein
MSCTGTNLSCQEGLQETVIDGGHEGLPVTSVPQHIAAVPRLVTVYDADDQPRSDDQAPTVRLGEGKEALVAPHEGPEALHQLRFVQTYTS